LYRQCIIDDYIPKIVDNIMNAMPTNLSSCEEVKQAIFDINREGAPTPNGLGTLYYDKYGYIVRTNVFEAVSHFFKIYRLLPNYNSNNVILIPKGVFGKRV